MLDLAKILSGLITVTVSSLLTIKALRLVVRVNRDNNHVSIQGDSNTVNIIKQYNDRIRENGGGYSLLGGVTLILLLIAFPFYSGFFSASLYVIAMICPLVALIAFATVLKCEGSGRIWDVWYVFGTVALSWVTISTLPYIENTAPFGAYIKPFQEFLAGLQYGGIFYVSEHGQLNSATVSAFVCVGFSVLYLSHLWLGFSFLKWRTFDGSLTHASTFLVIGVAGAAICSGWMLAYHFQRPEYASTVFHAVLDGPFGILRSP